MTTQQQFVLRLLHERGDLTGQQVADAMNAADPDGDLFVYYRVGYDRAHAILKGMERRGLVWRHRPGRGSIPTLWHVTDAGVGALRLDNR